MFKDDDIRKLLESLDIDEAEQLQSLDRSMDPSSDPLDQMDNERIRSLVFQKLNLIHEKPVRLDTVVLNRTATRMRRTRGLIALSAAILIVSALMLFSPNVTAQIQKLLAFMPGLGAVEEEDSNKMLYVLPAPVGIKLQEGEGEIEIRAINIGESISSLYAVGTKAPGPERMILSNDNGDFYTFDRQTMSSSGSWSAWFISNGPIRVTKDMKLSVPEENVRTPVILQTPQKTADLERLGQTVSLNGISLTAVVDNVHEKGTRITLVPKLPSGMNITNYGQSGKPGFKAAAQAKSNGKQKDIPLVREDVSPDSNVIYIQDQSLDRFDLTIPAVEVTKSLENPVQIQIPIPEQGSLLLKQKVNLMGSVLLLTKVERVKTADSAVRVRLYLEPENSLSNTQQFLSFIPQLSMGDVGSGAVGTLNESTQVMESIEMEVRNGAKELNFSIKQANFLIQGPWTFHLQKDSDTANHQ